MKMECNNFTKLPGKSKPPSSRFGYNVTSQVRRNMMAALIELVKFNVKNQNYLGRVEKVETKIAFLGITFD